MITSYYKELIQMDNLRKELVILRELGIKVNYAELARKYNCDYRIVKNIMKDTMEKQKMNIENIK